MVSILSIETSGSVCSVALHTNGDLISSSELQLDKSHASKLAVMIDHILRTSGQAKADLQAVAVSAGPGSYTGLRIGVSTAKGLCFALKVPLISIPSLVVMAAGVRSFNCERHMLCPMVDARRDEIYMALLDADLGVVEPSRSLVLNTQAIDEILSRGRMLIFGSGSAKFRDFLREQDSRALFPEAGSISARWMGALAYDHYLAGQFERLEDFEPLYLKEFTPVVRRA